MGSPAIFNFGSGSFSVEAWIKTTANGGQAVASKINSGGAGWVVQVSQDAGAVGALKARLSNGSTALIGYSDAVVSDGRWHQIVVVFDRSAGIQFYVDGAASGLKAGTVSGSVSVTNALLVGNATGGYPFYNGDVDEAAVYNTALSAIRVQAHYANSSVGDVTAPAPTLTLPGNGATVDDDTPTFAGTAGTALGDSAGVSVSLYAGSAVSGTPVSTANATSDVNGNWAVDISPSLPAGTYTAQAAQSDAAGNRGQSGTSTFTVSPQTYPTGDPGILAAGDIAGCDTDGDTATAKILDTFANDLVAPLGDNAYESGTLNEFQNCYGPTWGKAKARSRPIAGNHEYNTPNAAGYYAYFNDVLAPFGSIATDSTKGYYSYDTGAWHVVVLNTGYCETTPAACAAGSAQDQWLSADLAAHPSVCTLAYWHHPLFSSGRNAEDFVRPLYQTLYNNNVDLLLVGHDHDYERFAPQTPNGALDLTRGISEFVVGTGGRGFFTFPSGSRSNSEVRRDDTYGVLRLVLHAASYEWEFVPVAGSTFEDFGSRACH
jgi:hypothetical protein